MKKPKVKILYHVVVKGRDENRTVLFDQLVNTLWTFNQITAWMRRKFRGQWKSVYVSRADKNEWATCSTVEGICPETGAKI